jgi:tetratricopeptide (TPR) repeat protein
VSEPQPPPIAPFAEESPQAEHLPKWLEQFEEPAANTSDNTMNKGDAELTPPAWVMDNQIPDLGKDVEERSVDEQPEPIVVDKSPDKLKPIVEKNKPVRKKKKQELTVEPTETKKTLTPTIHPELDDVIIKAHNALTKGNLGIALDLYHQVIKEDYQLSKVIENLGEALDRYPVDPFIWERLGDAHSRANNLQEALEAYTKAEEFLK